MRRGRYILSFAMVAGLLLSTNFTFAASSSAYNSQNINGMKVNYVTVEGNNQNVKPIILNAGNQMNTTDSLANMAKSAGAFAAINGTYFEAYSGTPVPWGTMIKDGKVLHISQSGAVFGITSSGKLLVDRLTFDFEGYINGEYRAIPWRVNHPSTEAGAITIFTPEYGTAVKVAAGAKGVVVTDSYVTQIATADCYVPANGFVIVYNPDVSYLVDERYQIGDEVTYKVKINTTFTDNKDWSNVVVGLGAGPSLIINGVITAQGEAEGFSEAKINTASAARSFIGSTAERKIVIGNIPSATLMQAAQVCQSMGLVNAMCLDGGGSVALYYPSAGISTTGRNINNGLAFVDITNVYVTARPTTSIVLVDGENVSLTAYNIGESNYFKLRDLAMVLKGSDKQFEVAWDDIRKAIKLIPERSYTSVGGELSTASDLNNEDAYLSTAKVYFDQEEVLMKAYQINGNNYFKLRDVGSCINFAVGWDALMNTIKIDTASGYGDLK